MKRISTILASVAMVMAAMSCEPEQTPEISFGKAHYVLLAYNPLTIDVVTSVAPAADLTVELSFTGTAALDSDYSVSAQSVTIPAGETKGSVIISPKENFEADKNIVIAMTMPAGYVSGKNATATVAVEAREALIYSFVTGASDVVGSYDVIFEVKGVDSGSDWRAPVDIQVPYTITPLAGASASQIVADSEYFVIKAGESKAHLTVRPGQGYDNSKFEITVNDSKFSDGTNGSITLTVRGLLQLASLVGTWEFEEVIDLDELELWFTEYEDDPDLLPTHNEGFKFTVAQDGDNYKFTPSGEGDWMNYFRDCIISHCAPFNMCANGVVTGDYTSSEIQMFINESEGVYTSEFTYFSLSSVNRSFDSESETLGEGAIAICHDADDNLIVLIRDYDQPPFGEMWWDSGYEPDMFSFASRFTKTK